nr:MAG TPA: hypothetical protein [Caudoviricetes sp.]
MFGSLVSKALILSSRALKSAPTSIFLSLTKHSLIALPHLEPEGRFCKFFCVQLRSLILARLKQLVVTNKNRLYQYLQHDLLR